MTANGLVDFNVAVCEAFGLDPGKVKALELKMGAGDIPTLNVMQYVEGGGEVAVVLKRYKWIPLPDEDDE